MLRVQKLGNISTDVDIACRRWHIQFANTAGGLVEGSCQASYGSSVTEVET